MVIYQMEIDSNRAKKIKAFTKSIAFVQKCSKETIVLIFKSLLQMNYTEKTRKSEQDLHYTIMYM